jgi:para-nitrobenzyl esterase
LLPDIPPSHGGNEWTFQPTSEDCLVLNVWTPGTDREKRPVMVWVHGGAYHNGSGDCGWTDGAALARDHDVVVVHFNHRLNAFGFLYLAEVGGEEYADSGNVGMLDIVAVLEWIRDNIEGFGGDPGNVTVFGESGGGMKVSTLTAMPAAQGLFHRAVAQSGVALRATPPELADEVARVILARLGVGPGQLDRLQQIPAEDILATTTSAPFPGGVDWMTFGPVIDGRSLSRHPFEPDASPVAAGIPMLIGSNLNELTADEVSSEDALVAGLGRQGLSPDRVRELIDVYVDGRPHMSRPDVLADLAGDAGFRFPAILQAERQAATGTPVYMYLFTWPSPVFGGRSVHGLDIPFAFGIASRETLEIEPDAGTLGLNAAMSAAWASFARSGDPSHPGMPAWPRYSAGARNTMILDRDPHVEVDPSAREREAWFEGATAVRTARHPAGLSE